MDPIQVMEWLEENDELLSSLQTTILLYLHRKSSTTRHAGSKIGRREFYRNRLQGHQQLYQDYFSDSPKYPEKFFRRRFRMRKMLFLKIVDAIVEEDQYFVQKRDAAGRLGFSPLQKITAAMRLLAYGCSADSVDEYLRISKFFLAHSLK